MLAEQRALSRTTHPGIVLSALLLILAFLIFAVITRRANNALLVGMIAPIAACLVSALHFGERTFFPFRADQRTTSLSPTARRKLRVAQNIFLFGLVAGFLAYVTFFLKGSHYGFFQFLAYSCLIVSLTIKDLLAEPANRDPAPIEPLKL